MKMDPIKFNRTADYQHISVLGKSGVYTPKQINPKTLPEGFYQYNLSAGEGSMFGAVTQNDVSDVAGTLITKEPLPVQSGEERAIAEDDWSFEAQDFDFESYFGCKLSIDTQIEQAEAKREMMSESKRDKSRGDKESGKDDREID